MPNLNDRNRIKDFFIPNFCEARSLLMVLLVGELLAIVFTLLSAEIGLSIWNTLGLYSISIQIINLVSVALLCFFRQYFVRFTDWIAAALSIAVILLVTLVFSLGVIVLLWQSKINLGNTAQLELIIKNLFIAGIIGSVALRYFYLQQQFKKHVGLEAAARLEALQARIRPHFLFNSMNVIASLTRIDPKKAELAIQDLSDLFRSTLNNKDELIGFAIELENSKKYLALEQLRLGDRLKFTESVDKACLDISLPPLTIQPLLENAVYHGIQMLPEGGVVSLDARVTDEHLVLVVANPKPKNCMHKGNGIALKNIKQRLQVIYAGKASIEVEDNPTEYKIGIKIPKHKPNF
ncbi:sensor histidine kinase [Aliikangiella sp. IMCC44653]